MNFRLKLTTSLKWYSKKGSIITHYCDIYEASEYFNNEKTPQIYQIKIYTGSDQRRLKGSVQLEPFLVFTLPHTQMFVVWSIYIDLGRFHGSERAGKGGSSSWKRSIEVDVGFFHTVWAFTDTLISIDMPCTNRFLIGYWSSCSFTSLWIVTIRFLISSGYSFWRGAVDVQTDIARIAPELRKFTFTSCIGNVCC